MHSALSNDAHSNQYQLSKVQLGFVQAQPIDENRCNVPTTFGIEFRGEGATPGEIRAAWQTVVERHAALRTIVTRKRDTYVQEVLPHVVPEIAVVVLGRENGDEVLARLMREQVDTPFDLRVAPLWRAVLVKDERKDDEPNDHTQKWLLLVSFAHVIIDGASVAILAKDFAEALASDPQFQPVKSLGEVIAERAAVHRSEQEELAAEHHWAKWFGARRCDDSWGYGPSRVHVVPLQPIIPTPLLGLSMSLSTALAAIAMAAWAEIIGESPMFGFARAGRREGDDTVGPLHDHVPVPGWLDKGATLRSAIAAVKERRKAALDYLLPTDELLIISRQRTAVDVAFNFQPFGPGQSYEIRGRNGSVTVLPNYLIPHMWVDQASGGTPTAAFILHTEPDGSITGNVFGITGAVSEQQVEDLAVLFASLAELAAHNPDMPLEDLVRRLSTRRRLRDGHIGRLRGWLHSLASRQLRVLRG